MAPKRSFAAVDCDAATSCLHHSKLNNKRLRTPSPVQVEGRQTRATSARKAAAAAAAAVSPASSRNNSIASLYSSNMATPSPTSSSSSLGALFPNPDPISPTIENNAVQTPPKRRLTLGGPRKPNMKVDELMSQAKGIQSQLDSLLPEFARANENLTSKQNMEIDDSNDEGQQTQHIEMELACGVLEEKKKASSEEPRLPSPKIKLRVAKRKPVITDVSQPDMELQRKNSTSSLSSQSSESSNSVAAEAAKEPRGLAISSIGLPQFLQGGHSDEPDIFRTIVRHKTGNPSFNPSREEMINMEAETRSASSRSSSSSELSEEDAAAVLRTMRTSAF